MNTDLSKKLMAICMRSGVIIWAEKERAEDLMDLLEKPNSPKFICFDDEMLNVTDIIGIYAAPTMEALTRRQNGQWNCRYGNWHEKKDRCECVPKEIEKLLAQADEAMKNCQKCKGDGWYYVSQSKAHRCECVVEIDKKIEVLKLAQK